MKETKMKGIDYKQCFVVLFFSAFLLCSGAKPAEARELGSEFAIEEQQPCDHSACNATAITHTPHSSAALRIRVVFAAPSP